MSSAALAQGGAAPGGNPPYSGFWPRVGAYLLDRMVLGAAFWILTLVTAAVVGRSETALAFVGSLWLLILVVPWLYYAIMESSTLQATVGKLAAGIKVTNQAGERMGFGQATGRYFSHMLTAMTFGVGYAMAVFTSRRQALHDMVARTYVVRREFAPAEIGGYGPAPDAPAWKSVLAVCLCLFTGPALIGILAAISIPAYQDYTIRSQVTEGLNAAAPFKAAVANALAEGRMPREINSRTLDLSSPDGLRYVREVSVDSGIITILYGRSANRSLAGESLALAPA